MQIDLLKDVETSFSEIDSKQLLTFPTEAREMKGENKHIGTQTSPCLFIYNYTTGTLKIKEQVKNVLTQTNACLVIEDWKLQCMKYNLKTIHKNILLNIESKK